MEIAFSPEPSAHYLLDILERPFGPLPGRGKNVWPEFFDQAKKQRIYHWLAAEALERWVSELPPDVCGEIRRALNWNRARNLLLSAQMTELADLFRGEGIPLMFLKGAACLARGVYPPERRFLSDLDALVPPNRVDAARQALRAAGYEPEPSYQPHHIEHYNHARLAGSVEIHFLPFNIGEEDPGHLDGIFHDADTVAFQGAEIRVPSVTDHFWILLMTDYFERSFLPHLGNALEAALFHSCGFDPDYTLLRRRAEEWGVQKSIPGLGYVCKKYFGVRLSVTASSENVSRWEAYSLYCQRVSARGSEGRTFRKRYLVLSFLPDGWKSRLKFARRVLRNRIRNEYLTSGKNKPPLFLLSAVRFGRACLGYLGACAEWRIARMIYGGLTAEPREIMSSGILAPGAFPGGRDQFLKVNVWNINVFRRRHGDNHGTEAGKRFGNNRA